MSTIVGRMLNYLLTPIYTRLFDRGAYGAVTEIYAYVGFLNVLFTFRMETAYFRYAKEDARKAFATTAGAVAAVAIPATIVLCLLAGPIANWLDYPTHPEFITMMALTLGLDALCAIPFAKLRHEGKAKRFGVLKLINIGVNIICNLYFIVVMPRMTGHDELWQESFYQNGDGVAYVFLSNLVASAVTFVLLIPEYLEMPLPHKGFDRPLWNRILPYSWPLIIVGMAGMVNELLDRILLKQLLPGTLEEREAALGVYGANYKLAMLMTIFIQAFNFGVEPFFFKNHGEEDSKGIFADVGKFFAIAGCLVFLGITLYLDIWQHFIGQQFREGLDVVPVLLLANLCLGLYYNAGNWVKLTDRTTIGMRIALTGAAITIGLNVALVPTIGYMGAAWATLACYAYMLFESWRQGKKYYPIPYQVHRVLFYITLALAMYMLSDLIGMFWHLEGIFKLLAHSLLFGLYTYYVYISEKNGLLKAWKG